MFGRNDGLGRILDSGIEETAHTSNPERRTYERGCKCFEVECCCDKGGAHKIKISSRGAKSESSSSSSCTGEIVSKINSKITVQLPNDSDEYVFEKKDKFKAKLNNDTRKTVQRVGQRRGKQDDQLAIQLKELEQNVQKLTSYTGKLEVKLAAERGKSASLQKGLVTLTSECKTLRMHLESSNDQVRRLKANCEKLQHEAEEWHAMVGNGRNASRNLQQDLKSSHDISQYIDERLNITDKDLSGLKGQNQKLTHVVEELNSSVQTFKSGMIDAINKLGEEINQNKKEWQEVRKEINASRSLPSQPAFGHVQQNLNAHPASDSTYNQQRANNSASKASDYSLKHMNGSRYYDKDELESFQNMSNPTRLNATIDGNGCSSKGLDTMTKTKDDLSSWKWKESTKKSKFGNSSINETLPGETKKKSLEKSNWKKSALHGGNESQTVTRDAKHSKTSVAVPESQRANHVSRNAPNSDTKPRRPRTLESVIADVARQRIVDSAQKDSSSEEYLSMQDADIPLDYTHCQYMTTNATIRRKLLRKSSGRQDKI